MRYILTILLISALTNLNAQAPDFILTDTDGTTHNLYSYINEGKTVVLNFSTTDCSECWNFHETGNMNTANALYGPSGTDEMVFLLLEIDSLSGMNALQGEGLYTAGNWLTGTDFPIIDNAQDVAAQYGITDTPTVIAVCADTTTTDLYTAGYPTASSMYITHNKCVPTSTANELTIIDMSNEVFCGALKPQLILMNTGTDTINTAEIEFASDIQADTVNWVSTLAPNQYTKLTFNTIITEATTITATILTTNGMADGNTFTKTVEAAPLQFAERITISIRTDGFGCETQWDFTNETGAIINTGGNVDATAGNRTIEYDPTTGACSEAGYANSTNYIVSYPSNDTVIIPSGCYVFNIIDDWGDGICCNHGEGSYTITNQDGTVLATGDDFGAQDRIVLNITNEIITDIQQPIDKTTFKAFPNPAHDNFNISFDLNETSEVSVSMYNALGQRVQSIQNTKYSAGQNNIQVHTRELPSGIYFITLHTEIGDFSKRITIAKP